ncbi:MAG: ABC transporter permease subunit [Gemmatimonadota bacterium]
MTAGAFLWALAWSGIFSGEKVNRDGWILVVRFLEALTSLEISPAFLRVTARATIDTLAFAALGTTLTLAIGVVGGVLGSRVWWDTVAPSEHGSRRSAGSRLLPWLAVRGLLVLPRSVHEIVWGVLLVAVLGLDPLVAILAIGIPFGAITAKVFSELLDEAPRRSLNALRSAGAPPLTALLYSVVPTAFPDLLSYAFYRFECAIRSAAVLGVIGAGGLGYQLFLSLQSLRYEQVWTLLLALILLTGLSDLWSGLVRRALGAPARLDIGRSMSAPASDGGRTSSVVWTSLAGAVLLVVFSGVYLAPEVGRLWSSRTLSLAGTLLGEALPPSLAGLSLGVWASTAADTLAMSILALFLAAAGGILLSFGAARNVLGPRGMGGEGGRPVVARLLAGGIYAISRGLLLLLRGVPAPIWALLFLFVFFPGILPGALALGVYTMGVLGRLMAESVENLDPAPVRALRTQGASPAAAFVYGVLPAVLPRFTAYSLYRWEVAIRATAMVGLVGAGGLGRMLTEQMSSFHYAAVSTTLLVYVLLTWGVDLISSAVRRDLR